MIVDSHCHLQFKGFDEDRYGVTKRCKDKRTVMNLVGTQQDTSQRAVQLAEQHYDMFATIGLHPIHLFPTYVDEEEGDFTSRNEDFDEDFYSNLVKSPKVKAIGETGLDLYHLPKGIEIKTVLDKQIRVFLAQYDFAEKHGLPLVIHARDAHEQMLEIMAQLPSQMNGVMHCFGGNWTQAEQYLDMGLHIGFTGVITFPPKKTDPKAHEDLLEVVKRTPLDRILVETDAPFMAPQVYRGQKCEPWMVEEVIKKIAEIKEMKYEEVKQATVYNSRSLFCI